MSADQKEKPPVIGVDMVRVDSITHDPANVRKHDEANIEAIRASLNRFGQQKPIVISGSGVVVAGNGTLVAARSLGWDHVAAVRTSLVGAEATAYAIADNRTAELATWDSVALAETLAALQNDESVDELATGFTESEITEIIDNASGVVADEEDEVPEPQEKPVTKRGDLILLGEHRLLCGDSTNADDVARLMDGDTASLVFADPPYGISYQSNMRTKSAKFSIIKGDSEIITDWIPNTIKHSQGWVFVWTTWKVLNQWLQAVAPFGKMSNMVIWNKGGGGIGDLKHTFLTDYEIAFVFNRGAEICGKRIGSVWSFGKDAAGSYVHPTQKPVALAAEAIANTTRVKSLILDIFLGSGSTLIAAEQLNRRCYGMEIDPAYCDVIVQRWENLTGKTADRLSAADV